MPTSVNTRNVNGHAVMLLTMSFVTMHTVRCLLFTTLQVNYWAMRLGPATVNFPSHKSIRLDSSYIAYISLVSCAMFNF